MWGLHPELVRLMELILDHMYQFDSPMFVIEGLRTAAKQRKLWRKGRRGLAGERKVTYKDGVTHKSRHQASHDAYGRAIDCAFVPSPSESFPFAPGWPWDEYGHFGESLGLTWGGRYPKLVDRPHFELP
jgi:hypothetical protein